MLVGDESRPTEVAEFSWNWVRSWGKGARTRREKKCETVFVGFGLGFNLCWDCHNQEQQSTATHSVSRVSLATMPWLLFDQNFLWAKIIIISHLTINKCSQSSKLSSFTIAGKQYKMLTIDNSLGAGACLTALPWKLHKLKGGAITWRKHWFLKRIKKPLCNVAKH